MIKSLKIYRIYGYFAELFQAKIVSSYRLNNQIKILATTVKPNRKKLLCCFWTKKMMMRQYGAKKE